MTFTSFLFWGLTGPALLFVYHVCARRAAVQNVVLILAMCLFYGLFGWKNLAVLAVCILLTWAGGGLTAHLRTRGMPRAARTCFILALVLNLGILAVFKYGPFFAENVNLILGPLGRAVRVPDWLLPVGLSFYIFQSSSYLIDVYRGDVTAEKNPVTYAAFVSFFPTIVSGPILKSRQHLPAFRGRRTLSYEVFQRALVRFLYGALLKMIIADRLAIFVNSVYDGLPDFAGPVTVLAALAYTLQIYADFAGYSHMAVAVAAMLGFRVDENFRQPYLAVSIVDFWRRWHISLTSWFRDYLYIPLGGNRKGTARKYVNVVIVFLVSGLWHGAAWTFVIWGALHALFQIIEMIGSSARMRSEAALRIGGAGGVRKGLRRAVVFVLVGFAWIFFRSPDLRTAGVFVASMFRGWGAAAFSPAVWGQTGLGLYEWIVCLIGIVFLAVVSGLRERGTDCAGAVLRRKFPVRAVVLVAVFGILLVWGVYGPAFEASSFIYAGF